MERRGGERSPVSDSCILDAVWSETFSHDNSVDVSIWTELG
jgi:hypothetical protein